MAEREPEFIVVFYSGTAGGQVVADPGNELGQARIQTLKANPTIANVPAIINGRFILIDSVQGQPGPSTVEAVERMAAFFHPQAIAE